jgi:hypothetical protein
MYGHRPLSFYGLHNLELRVCRAFPLDAHHVVIWQRLGGQGALSEMEAFTQRPLNGSVEICNLLLHPPVRLPHVDRETEKDEPSQPHYERLLVDAKLDETVTVAALKRCIGRSHPRYSDYSRLPIAASACGSPGQTASRQPRTRRSCRTTGR